MINERKILTKLLANRLATFIELYINKDQVEFIPDRQGPDKVQRTVDLVSILQSDWVGGHKQEGMLLSLQLQKAFDSVHGHICLRSLSIGDIERICWEF